jgi:uncharacterized protein (TIGR02001 family)
MYKSIAAAIALTTAALAPAAYAQDEAESDIKITGNVSLTSQYRLRGISQTEEDFAIQGGITVAHSSGFYVGTWASNLSGFGSFGGSNTELDLIAGYSKAVGSVTLDGGIVYYVYPGTGGGFDFFDLYGAVSFPAGPINTKVAVYYAPDDSALGGNDNLWIYSDFAFPIEGTPVTLKAHVGYTDGALGGPTGKYLDYSFGADFTYENLTLNLSYIDTDISKAKVINHGWGGTYDIVDGAFVATLTAAF